MANSFAFVLSRNNYPDAWQAKLIGVDQGTRIVYSDSETLTSASKLFVNSKLTQPLYGDDISWYGIQLLTNTSVKYALTISESGVIDPVANPVAPADYLLAENGNQLITENDNFIILN